MKSKKINKTKRRIKRNNLLVQSIHEDYYLDQYATTVRKKYGLKYKNNKGNIQSGLEHLMEMSHNNPLGII